MSKLAYYLQYRVCMVGPSGEMVDVAFHGPGRIGFVDTETANTVVAALHEADKQMNQARVYLIVPCSVSSDFDSPGLEELGSLFGELTDEPAPSGSTLN